ncbi:hypothetical protein HNR46_003571 [Haloferula luteola]|uniref:Uncharacterized protein n=1 Tax=Haloferula luteola TaxID=595692 RepID=A0A840V5L8_9BACT|nr:hypothetical protein [Haloferula luteola]
MSRLHRGDETGQKMRRSFDRSERGIMSRRQPQLGGPVADEVVQQREMERKLRTELARGQVLPPT